MRTLYDISFWQQYSICDEATYKQALQKVKRIIESYANGGLQYLEDVVKENPEAISDIDFFLELTETKT